MSVVNKNVSSQDSARLDKSNLTKATSPKSSRTSESIIDISSEKSDHDDAKGIPVQIFRQLSL